MIDPLYQCLASLYRARVLCFVTVVPQTSDVRYYDLRIIADLQLIRDSHNLW